MAVFLKTFDDNIYQNNDIAQGQIKLDSFNIKNIPEDFIISQNKKGEIIARYSDDIWDLSPYKMNPSQNATLNFESRIIDPKNIIETKRLMLLLLLFGSGRGGSKYSVSTIQHYFDDAMIPLSNYALLKKISISQLLSNNKYLFDFISLEQLRTRRRVLTLSSFLVFLDRLDNRISTIEFKRDKHVFDILKNMRSYYDKNIKQTKLIPSRILAESLKQRWEQINEIEKNMENLTSFLNKYLSSEKFAASASMIRVHKWKDDKDTVLWDFAVKQYHLSKLFKKYNIKNRRVFQGLIINIQGTSRHLIHAYTGMRNGEVLNLKTNCLETANITGNTSYIISTTSKLEGTKKSAKWVTSKEIRRVIDLLKNINFIIVKRYNLDIDDLPLFIKGSMFVEFGKVQTTEIDDFHLQRFNQKDELPLDNSKLLLTLEDISELNEINFNNDTEDLQVGEPWIFTSHQYRRSLAVYSIQSGLVSLGVLQIQLKHLFREMTLYYGNGASYAKKLFNVPKEHIANDIDLLKPDIEALAYIKEVIFADEQLFGTHGTFVERNKKVDKKNQAVFLLENREKTAKQFKNGEIAYKNTAVGGCVSLEACDYALTRSIISCPGCDSGIIKKSKLDNVINEQKEFIELLDNDSIEYRTEVRDLEELEKQRKIFLGSKA